MSTIDTTPEIDSGHAFPSLAALRAAHAVLVQRRRDEGDSDLFLDAVAAFVHQGQLTGLILDDNPARVSAQSLLDYWANVLSRARRDAPDATLVDFDPALAPELPDDMCPYLGLDAFSETEAGRFFGRERLVAELVEKLKNHRLLAVVGPSGSGKSSLVRAGLVPKLKSGALPGSENWSYLGPIVPGSEPLANLQQTAQVADTRHETRDTRPTTDHRPPTTVLVVDQFEETFTLCEDREVREAFVARLLEIAESPNSEHRIILTMRSDFETFVARFPELQQLWEAGRVQVTPMSAAEVREAIEQPAERVGLKFEAGVVDSLLADIVGEPAALPLLQFTLLRLWEERDHNRVTTDTYRKVGGGRLALARAADAIYNTMIPEDQRTARRILLRMVRPGEGLEITSSRVRRAALYRSGEDIDRIDRVLERLIKARLVRLTDGETAADDQVEVAHEALVRNWPTLVDWLEQERAAITTRRRLETRAKEWVRLGQGKAGLLDEVELREVEHWLEGSAAIDLGYDPALLSLVETSRRTVNTVIREKEQAAKRLRRLASGLAVALALALIATGYAFIQQSSVQQSANTRATAVVEAQQARATAQQDASLARTAEADAQKQRSLVQTAQAQTERQREIIDAQRLAAASRSQSAAAPETALLLAYEAAAHDDNPVTGHALRDAIDQASLRPLVFQGHTSWVLSAAFSPDGQRIVTASADDTAWVWDLQGQVLTTLQGHTGAVRSVAFSLDGQLIVTASDDGTTRVWNLQGQVLTTLQGHTGAVLSAAFSPDGQRIVTASVDKTARVWNLQGQALTTLQGHTGAVLSAAFSPDGQRIVTASADNTARVWDLQGQILTTLQGHTAGVRSAAFSLNGQRIVTASYDQTARVWDLRGQVLTTLRGHTSWVLSAAFSPDGQRIVTASADKTARVWDLQGQILTTLQGHAAAVLSAAFSPDGQRIVTASEDGTARVWDLRGQVLTTLQGHTGAVRSVAFSPDGQRIVTASEDGTARVWDLQGQVLAILLGHTSAVRSVAFSPDGQRIVTASEDGTARIWNLQGQVLTTLQDHIAAVWRAAVLSAAFSPDGQRIVTASEDGTARIWNLQGQVLTTLQGHTAAVLSAAFSPDGQRIVTASEDGTARVWDLQGQVLTTLQGHSTAVNSAAFSPDGQRIVTASEDGTARVWNLQGQVLIALQGHTSWVLSAAFSPDGQRIVTASQDWTARVWDLQGQVLTTLQGHTAAVLSAAFSPDGQRIVTASVDKTARQYLANTSDLLAVAACRVGRGLTDDEIARFQVPTPLKFDFSKRQCPAKLPGEP